jgi:hypothetical protein
MIPPLFTTQTSRRRSIGFGFCDQDLGPLFDVYAMLAASSPRLALAKARGVQLAPFTINVRAVFPNTDTVVVPDVGSDVKIVQDTLIDSLVIRVQNESTTANQSTFQAQSDFFFSLQSGLEATLDVQGAPRYSVAPKFTPISVLGDLIAGPSHWPGGWVLTYQQQLQMSFNAKVALPYAPLEVICTFRSWTPVTAEFMSMGNDQAIALLQSEFGIVLSDAYKKRVLQY